MRLLLVRHGITQNNLDKTYTGQTDVPLTELGRRQAEAVASYLSGEKLDVIISSDLQRARDTAVAIARYHKLPVQEDPDLREISMGWWESLGRAQIEERDKEEFAYVRADPVNRAPTGGENFAQLRERAARILQRCKEQYPGQTILWVTHGGFIEGAICHALKLDLAYRHCFRQENTSVTELQFIEELPWIARLNDIAHLRLLLLPEQDIATNAKPAVMTSKLSQKQR
ncbi:MAG TPA: histidine phosphatase family protein [Ktedonobacteraceae bacterium]|nr:histidine phosphatase family protein [Ktedonobacteraceae bacterium]